MLLMPAYEAWWWGRFPAFHAVSTGGREITAAEMLTSSAYLMKAEDAGRELGRWKEEVEEDTAVRGGKKHHRRGLFRR